MGVWTENVERYPKLAVMATPAFKAGWEINGLAEDLLKKADRYVLTPRQAQVLEGVADRYQRQLERRREASELKAAGVRCPEGRTTVTGQIVSLKWQTSYYGRRESTVQKMVVRAAAGWAVWATVPAGLPAADLEVGAEIEFQATVERSDRDPLFGFAKRPTRARLLETEAVQ
jgi:hypothetical protein